ncbi:MAG: hypothetical protein EGR86_02930 [Ruminiclostridium sp.]|nr:hypothetical protein [Ruminiclostridium sp.]
MQYKKGGYIASRKQQSNSLCLAVNPPPFDKGGKCDSVFRGIVRSGGHGGVTWALLKHYCFTTEHHFDDC